MIINTMAYMLIISIIGLLKLRVRYDRLLSWFMFFVLFCLFGEYYFQNLTGNISGFSFLWGTSQIGDITVDFHPSTVTNQIVIPLFFITVLTVLNNNIFRYEERKSLFNSLIMFNFVSLSMLICAKNYVQLITSIFATDVLGYLILKDTDSSRRYMVYNFFADMCLFMIFAMACGRIHSLDISSLLGYEQIGKHKDFVSIITALALFVKIGCFLFQSYLLDISSTRFQRMIMVNLMFAPMIGILLLLKLHNLLIISDLFMPIFTLMTILTFLAGIIGFISRRNIQKKVIFLNMAYIGLLMQILKINDFNWSADVSFYYLAMYMSNQLFFKLYLYQNRENDVAKMINATEINTTPLKIILLQSAVLNALFVVLIFIISENAGNMYLLCEACLLFVAQALIFNHIYKSPLSRRLDYLNPNAVRKLSFIVNSILLGWGIYLCFGEQLAIFCLMFIFLWIVASSLGKGFRHLYDIKKLQEKDLSKSLFSYTLVLPITYLSRMVWLMMDIFLSEKIITASVSALERNSIALFLKINRKNYGACLLFIIIGISIFIVAYYKGQR